MSAALPPPGVTALGLGAGREVRDTLVLLRTAETAIRRQFLVSVRDARLLVDLEAAAALLEAGRVGEALATLESVGPELSAAVNTAYSAAGVNAALEIQRQLGVDVRVNFNLLSTRSVARLQENRLRLVTAFAQEGQEVANAVLQAGVARGEAALDIARDMRASLGLTPVQARWVENYRTQLQRGSLTALNRQLRDRRFDRTVQAVAAGRRGPLTAAEIDRMVDRYRDRQLAHRAVVVAQTESLRAVNEGEEEMWRQAVDDGTVEQVTQVWRTVGDSKVRDSHDGMNGQARPLGEAFQSDRGNALRWPGDSNAPASETVNCRCVVARTATRAGPAAGPLAGTP